MYISKCATGGECPISIECCTRAIHNSSKHKHTKELGQGCSSVGRVVDRHATDIGSILWCGKGFFLSESALSAEYLMVSKHHHVQSLASVYTFKILWFLVEFCGLWKHVNTQHEL